MGALRAWHIYPLPPASGQIFNVAAVVLPGPMPVTDHDQQLPMFPPERLLRMLEGISQIQREMAETQRLMAQKLGGEAAQEPSRPRRYVPQNKAFREWSSFRTELQKIERSIRRDLHLRPEDEVTREMVYTAGGPNPKTLRRIMEKSYGLQPEFWPPSIWPAELPPTP